MTAAGLRSLFRYHRGITGIAFVYFTEKDVVRHRLVQDIIKAYERHSEKSPRPKTSRRAP